MEIDVLIPYFDFHAGRDDCHRWPPICKHLKGTSSVLYAMNKSLSPEVHTCMLKRLPFP